MTLLNDKLVLLDVKADTAEQAIRMAGQLLLEQNKVTPSYVDAMVKGYQDIGAYIVLAPSIAIPHARPEHGVLERCMSVVRLKEPVVFGHPDNDPVRIVCAIGGVDNCGHIEILQMLSDILGDQNKLSMILETSDVDTLLSAFS